MVIRRVSPISCAKIAGLLYAVIGLIIGAFFSLFFLVFGPLAGYQGFAVSGPMHGTFGFGGLMGAAAIIVLPILYGVMGFVTTAIAAVLYNVIAGVVGGVEIDVDQVAAASR